MDELSEEQRQPSARQVVESWMKRHCVSVGNIWYPRREFAITGTHYESRSRTTVIHLAEPTAGGTSLDELKVGMFVSFDDDPSLAGIIRVDDPAVSVPAMLCVEHLKRLVRVQQEELRLLSGAVDFTPVQPAEKAGDVTRPVHCPFCLAPITAEPDSRYTEYGDTEEFDCPSCNRSFTVWNEDWQEWRSSGSSAPRQPSAS